MIKANTWKLQSRFLSIKQPLVMGILNVTPDSFSDGAQYLNPVRAIERAKQIEEEGAHILDVGAESSRPGAIEVSPEQEWNRLNPILTKIIKQIEIPLSVDTRHAEVARRCLELGVEIINDVSCAQDIALIKTVAKHEAGYILMHTRGNPQNMLQLAQYSNVVEQVLCELEASYHKIKSLGIADEHICLDPGVGFAKNSSQNYQLIHGLSIFKKFNRPLLIGLSRKKFLREMIGENLEQVKIASLAGALYALNQGAQIIRVHDVKATQTAFRIWQQFTAG